LHVSTGVAWCSWKMTEWASIGLQELLDADLRPSLVIDLGAARTDHPRILYRNPNFTTDYDFDDTFILESGLERGDFQSWAFYPISKGVQPSFDYCGLTWVANILRERYRLIQATSLTPYRPQSDNHSGSPAILSPGFASAQSERLKGYHDTHPNHDWTRLQTPADLSPHVELLRSWDWGKTSLGPVSSWSPLLRLMANLIVVDPSPVRPSSRSPDELMLISLRL
jgi:hypothetical protein